MLKILRINARTRSYTFEDPKEYAKLGGRALTSKLILNEVPANSHPLSAANKIVAAVGLLSGTTAANSGRLSLGTKSPLTGGIKESNTGGNFCIGMKRAGIQAIVLEDKPEPNTPLCTIRINGNSVSFEDASALEGMQTYACMEKLGPKSTTMLIGPAGENCLTSACIMFTDPNGRPARAAGRGGLGAVMGSKRIKAIIIEGGTERPKYADDAKFKEASKRWMGILRGNPALAEGMPAFGTAMLVNVINEAGALPVKNFRYGRFDKVDTITAETMVANIKARGGKVSEGCHSGCIIQCSQEYRDAAGKYLTSGFEYETIWAFGANAMIADIDIVAQLDRMCDELGLDTIETGNAIAIAMDGGVIPWGDGEAACKLLARVGDKNDYLGKIIGSGVGFAAQAFGVDRVPVVKNQSLPAYDPRAIKGIGVTYATSPMGGDHTAGYSVCQNILGVGGSIPPLGKEGQVEVSKALQIATATLDSLGLCLFVAFAVLDSQEAVPAICDMLSAYHGIDFTPEDFGKLGESVLLDEYKFNENAGFTAQDDQLPAFFSTDKLETHNVNWDFSVEELQKAKV